MSGTKYNDELNKSRVDCHGYRIYKQGNIIYKVNIKRVMHDTLFICRIHKEGDERAARGKTRVYILKETDIYSNSERRDWGADHCFVGKAIHERITHASAV